MQTDRQTEAYDCYTRMTTVGVTNGEHLSDTTKILLFQYFCVAAIQSDVYLDFLILLLSHLDIVPRCNTSVCLLYCWSGDMDLSHRQPIIVH